MAKANLDLTAMLAGQLVGHHFGPQAPEAYDKPTNIVLARNGVFRVVKTPIALFNVKVADIPSDKAIPGIGEMTEGPQLLIPKIPLKYLIMILTFYRDVHAKDKTEASALFFWNHNEEELPTHYEATQLQKNRGEDGDEIKGLIQDGQLIIYCPQQKNSGSLSEFHEDGMVNYLREHCTPLCETHSHHTMGAFWSGTDDANENMTQFYGVWGNIDKDEPNFLFRWVCGGTRVNIDPSLLFDIPQVEIKTTVTKTVGVEGFAPVVEETVTHEPFKGPWQRIEAPADWMGQHRKSWGGYSYGSAGKKTYNQGGLPNQGTIATGYWPENGYDYDYLGYGHGTAGSYGSARGRQDADDIAAANAEAQGLGKKKETPSGSGASKSAENAPRTEVEIFLEKNLTDDTKTVGEVEGTVKEIISELIELGYDYVISDTMTEQSGYGYLHGRKDWYLD
jgi:hypothetical protein